MSPKILIVGENKKPIELELPLESLENTIIINVSSEQVAPTKEPGKIKGSAQAVSGTVSTVAKAGVIGLGRLGRAIAKAGHNMKEGIKDAGAEYDYRKKIKEEKKATEEACKKEAEIEAETHHHEIHAH